MITEALFKKCVKALADFYKWEDEINELGLNIWEVDEVIELEGAFEALLAYICKENTEDIYPTVLEYFLYDCLETPPALIDKEIKLDDENDLWEFYIKLHPEIEDNKIRSVKEPIETLKETQENAE